jgi:hypothetical protein
MPWQRYEPGTTECKSEVLLVQVFFARNISVIQFQLSRISNFDIKFPPFKVFISFWFTSFHSKGMLSMRFSSCHNNCHMEQVGSQGHSFLLGFWTLSIVRNSINKETQRFGNWICFRPQVRGGTYSTKSLKKAYLATGDVKSQRGQALETRGL